MNKRILILSHEPLSNKSSNGRTLRNFFLNYPREQIAQFYLHGVPDDEVCANFFRVSDRDALNSFLLKKKENKNIRDEKDACHGEVKKVNKNCKTMVLRDIVWRSYRWWGKSFTSFIDNFAPEVLLLQAGDAPFMFAIALRIAKKYKVPIVIYNSEDYVLKDKIYSKAVKNSFWHKWHQSRLRKIYKKIMQKVSFCIYSTEYLEEKYQEKFPHKGKSCALYTVSELETLPDDSKDRTFTLLYCGNLGVGRVDPLCDLAKALYRVEPSARLDICGRFPDEESKQKLCANPNVSYGGVVSYDEVPKLMSKASMLVHCENKERLENLRGAFSTKIADSLASGRPFLVYAIKEYPFVKYLEKYKCAHIVSDESELEFVLRKCIDDCDYRNKHVKNACNIAKLKHSAQQNCLQLEKILNDI